MAKDTDNRMTPISVSGGYWTGSSAAVDLLSEHPECAVVPDEFTLFSFGQWFQEVFVPLTENRLDPVLLDENQVRYKSFNKSDMFPIRAIARRVCSKLRVYPPLFFRRRAGMSRELGPGYDAACRELESLLETANPRTSSDYAHKIRTSINEIINSAVMGSSDANRQSPSVGIFDQIVAPPYVKSAIPALDRFKYINIDRDWRDQYISLRPNISRMTRINERLGIRPWDEVLGRRFDSHVQYFLHLRGEIDKAKRAFQLDEGGDMLWLDYEDVVLESKSTAMILFDFLGLDPALWVPGSGFFPEVSRKRIGKWKRLGQQDRVLLDEIEQIGDVLGTPADRL